MFRRSRILLGLMAVLSGLLVTGLSQVGGPARAQTPPPPVPNDARIALVIGNAAYRAGALATPANDAGLLAETLRQSGFDVVGARDLDQDSIRRAFRDFLEKAQNAGPGATAFVYLSGYGVQYAGENYYVPVEANLPRDSAIPIETLRLSDFTRALAAIPLKARVVVLDMARATPFLPQGQLAGGLVLMDPEPGTLYAFNAAPGTVGPNEPGPYGAYAQALNEMMREGLPLNDIFAQVRLRVNETTKGLEVPWNASTITDPLVFFERAPDAPALPALSQEARVARTRPIQDYSVDEAYAVAVERDTIRAYQDFLNAYPTSPQARRVRALLAARREAITWDRTLRGNTPNAYWTYLQRYPRGPHAPDARRRLALLSAALEPPPSFEVYSFGDLPPPPPEEVTIIDDRPYVYFDDDYYAPPPPPPVFLIERPRREFYEFDAPPPPPRPGFLPIPIPLPVPWSRPFGYGQRPQPPIGQPQQFVPLPNGVTPPQGFGNVPRFDGGPRVGQTAPQGGRPPFLQQQPNGQFPAPGQPGPTGPQGQPPQTGNQGRPPLTPGGQVLPNGQPRPVGPGSLQAPQGLSPSNALPNPNGGQPVPQLQPRPGQQTPQGLRGPQGQPGQGGLLPGQPQRAAPLLQPGAQQPGGQSPADLARQRQQNRQQQLLQQQQQQQQQRVQQQQLQQQRQQQLQLQRQQDGQQQRQQQIQQQRQQQIQQQQIQRQQQFQQQRQQELQQQRQQQIQQQRQQEQQIQRQQQQRQLQIQQQQQQQRQIQQQQRQQQIQQQQRQQQQQQQRQQQPQHPACGRPGEPPCR